MDTRFASLVTALRTHASSDPEGRAYVFLDERGAETASLTFAELDRRASLLADFLLTRAAPGDRALLVFPPGLDFVVAFFACQYAGIIAVPTIMPRHNRVRDSSVRIVEDCAPRLGLTIGGVLLPVRAAFAEVPSAGIDWLGVDAEELYRAHKRADERADKRQVPGAGTIAFLQYTSGSTSEPKGVMVSHGNICANLEMISVADDLGRASTRVGWIPLYHDMGLIFNALQATYVGALCVLMSPVAFVAHALSWLRAIHTYRADMAIAPNFAYDLCLEQYNPERMQGVDLSCWRLALNGAEPVRASTIDNFARTFAAHGLRPSAPHPTYGMAEATLMISGGQHGGHPRLWTVSREALQRNLAFPPAGAERTQTLVGCGKELVGEKIAIVDPDTKRRLSPEQIGEIWVQGPNVAQGYWERPDATRETFQAQIEGEDGARWLRTGDSGCLDKSGEVYITGRIKDMMIVRGVNYYPQDIELTAEKSHPALRRGYVAAFTIPRDGEHESLVIACEIRKEHLHRLDAEDVVGAVRMSVLQEHEITVHRVLLAPPGTIPKTTSGKIRRRATRERWLDGELTLLDDTGGPRAPRGRSAVGGGAEPAT
jgi:acyl-CoA synthetase (AMP-forming)/AMP-acid ligase II